MARIAVVGAGLAGLVVAGALGRDHDVVVFEKSRGVGGRMATRYAGAFEFDHGAQFLTARSNAFRSFLAPLEKRGVIAPWHARFAELRRSQVGEIRQWSDDYPHYVGVPRMNAVGKWLARDIDIRTGTTVEALVKADPGWRLRTDTAGPPDAFDWVVFTAPPAQTAALLPHGSLLREDCDTVKMTACFALLLGFSTAPSLTWQATRVRDADISWMSANHSKPGRPPGFSLVAHSTNAWADTHLEDRPEAVRAHLLSEVSAVAGIDAGAAEYVELHRWRYANIARQDGKGYAIDDTNRVAAAGDWFVRGRVEGAFQSASALTTALAALL
jgi:predicted NAD/FAD-dependent oxidoreductase